MAWHDTARNTRRAYEGASVVDCWRGGLQSLVFVHSWHYHTAQRAALGGENHCSHPFHCWFFVFYLPDSRGAGGVPLHTESDTGFFFCFCFLFYFVLSTALP